MAKLIWHGRLCRVTFLLAGLSILSGRTVFQILEGCSQSDREPARNLFMSHVLLSMGELALVLGSNVTRKLSFGGSSCRPSFKFESI